VEKVQDVGRAEPVEHIDAITTGQAPAEIVWQRLAGGDASPQQEFRPFGRRFAGKERRVKGRHAVKHGDRVSAQQLVSNVRPKPSRFGEVRGPGYAFLDLGFLKNVDLGGRLRLQLRAEVYNALNRANFGNPNTGVTNSAFGTITRATLALSATVASRLVSLFILISSET
jgi:hypothetical protein